MTGNKGNELGTRAGRTTLENRNGKSAGKRANNKVKKRRRQLLIVKLLAVAVVIILIALVGLYTFVMSLFSKVETTVIDADELMINTEVEESIDFGEGYFNIAIFGSDSRDGEVEAGSLSDTIIIASLNNETKEVKLVSVYRDTYLNLSDDTYNKCNAAYSLGGPVQAINMLNTNLDLNIEKYITVDFTIVTDIVDLLGGVEIEIDESEIDYINEYIPETASVAGKEAILIEEAGLQVLDGVQATTYARIRSTAGGDFKRTDRQRYLIEQMLVKLKQCNLSTINEIIDTVLPRISTNFTATEIAYYAAAYLDIELVETMGFPEMVTTGTIPSLGDCVIPVTLLSNVESLHEFLFPDLEYEASAQVISNSYEIQYRAEQYGVGVSNSNESYSITYSETSITNSLIEESEEEESEEEESTEDGIADEGSTQEPIGISENESTEEEAEEPTEETTTTNPTIFLN